MPSKQLILLLDGTWNDAEEGPSDTNIVRLRELINQSLSGRAVASAGKTFASSRAYDSGAEPASGERQRFVFYERGVGTGFWKDQLLGGAFGAGLGNNVRRAYKFLSSNYETNDDIFIFGFSRGAYTARSLVGMIFAAGLLRRECCTPEREQAIWEYYRTPVNDRLPAVEEGFKANVHDRNKFKISCLGVFDTVGSLGMPLDSFRRKNRELYGFHNVEITSITEVSLHALAIDEHRKPFRATPWFKPKFKAFRDNMHVEQVWFSGAHGNVGGGYVPEDERRNSDNRKPALDDIALDWMLKRVLRYFPDFPVRLSEPIWPALSHAGPPFAAQAEQRMRLYRFWPRAYRTIANNCGKNSASKPAPLGWREEWVGEDRHAEPIGEMVHVSALQRYGKKVDIVGAGLGREYRPPGLRATLALIKATYLGRFYKPSAVSPSVLVVDWNGEPMKTTREGALQLIKIIKADPVLRKDFLSA